MLIVFVRAGEAGRNCGPRSRLGSRTIVRLFINSSKNTGSTGQAQAAGEKKKTSQKNPGKSTGRAQAKIQGQTSKSGQ